MDPQFTEGSTDDLITQTPVSERRNSGWDLRNAPRNYLWLVIAQGGGAFFSFASVLLLTRTIGSEGYGSIVAVIAASQVIQMFVNWSSIALNRFGVEEFVKTGSVNKAFWNRMYILIPNLLLVLGVALFWFPPLSSWYKLPPEAFLLVLVHLISGAFWMHIQYSLQGLKLPTLLGALAMGEKLLILAAVLALHFTNALTVFSAVVAYALAPLAMSLAALAIAYGAISFPSMPDRHNMGRMLSYAVPLFPFSVISYFSSNYLDAAFIVNFMTVRDVAVYAVGAQISAIALQLPVLANSLLLPLFVTMQTDEDQQTEKTDSYFSHLLPLLTLLWSGGCALLGLIGFYLLPIAFGSEFAASGIVLCILLIATTYHAAIHFGYAPLANSHLFSSVSLYSALLTAGTNVVMNILLIPRMGLEGCALATAAAYFVTLISFIFFLRRKIAVKVSWLPAAVFPSIASLAALVVTSSPVWAAAAWIFCAAAVIMIFYSSARKGAQILLNQYQR